MEREKRSVRGWKWTGEEGRAVERMGRMKGGM